MKKKKVSSFTSLKTALLMIATIFNAMGAIIMLVYHFGFHEDSTEVIGFFVMLFLISLYLFCISYKEYKSPEYQSKMKQSQEEWKQYKETRKEEKKFASLNNSYESATYEEPKKSHNVIFWIFASIGLAIYTFLGIIFRLQEHVAPINARPRRRGRRRSRRR